MMKSKSYSKGGKMKTKGYAKGGRTVDMNSADVPQRKRMAAGENVTGQTIPGNKMPNRKKV